jgi:ketosteroid isomerase-like protein
MHQDRRVTETVGQAEQALYRAMVAQDFSDLEALLADGLSYVHSTGVMESKRGYLAGVANGLYDYERIQSHDVITCAHGDIAVQTGTVEMSVGARGQPREVLRLLFTLLWTRTTGGWQLSRRQATRIPPGTSS